jgi:hypothetical protein
MEVKAGTGNQLSSIDCNAAGQHSQGFEQNPCRQEFNDIANDASTARGHGSNYHSEPGLSIFESKTGSPKSHRQLAASPKEKTLA